MTLNYAASPLAPRKHAPQLDTEWWVGRDGLSWQRPYRGLNALGDTFPDGYDITHNPMNLTQFVSAKELQDLLAKIRES